MREEPAEESNGSPQEQPTGNAPDKKKDDAEAAASEAAKTQRSRKMISSCTSIEPWLLERFPLDSKEVVITHVVHRTTMLPHFQIRLTSGASHDGKWLAGTAIF